MRLVLRQLSGIPLESHRFGPNKSLHMTSSGERITLLRVERPAIRSLDLTDGAVGALQPSRDAIVGTDESGYESRRWLVVQFLWSVQLLEAAVIHDCDM